MAMLFQFNFYSSLLLISFTQGIVFSVLLFIKGLHHENKATKWLSLFVFLCSLYIAPWMLGFAGWYDNQPYRDLLFYIPFLHLFFIGPVIYFYIQSLLNPAFKFTKKEFLQLIPGILYLLYSLIVWLTDKVMLKEYYFYEDGSDKDFASWYQILGLTSMFSYFFISLKYYRSYRKLIFQITSYANQIVFNWIRNFLYAFLAMLLLRIVFYMIPFFIGGFKDYSGIWWHYLFFSIILYYIAITGYSNPVVTKIGYTLSYIENKPIYFLSSNENNNEANTIDIEYQLENEMSEEVSQWKLKLIALIEKEELFKNPELTLSDVAKKLETNTSIISKTINQGFQMNFNDFINNYRIEAVKTCLKNDQHKKTTLLGIALDCGFNSKATFNRAFKKSTGLSPKDYLLKI